MILLEFAGGATGSLHVTSLAYEPGPFGQRHEMELHGSAGSLRSTTDWLRVQRVEGCRDGEAETRVVQCNQILRLSPRSTILLESHGLPGTT